MDCHVTTLLAMTAIPRNDGPEAVIASVARQSMKSEYMDCHGLRPRNDESGGMDCRVTMFLAMTGFGGILWEARLGPMAARVRVQSRRGRRFCKITLTSPNQANAN